MYTHYSNAPVSRLTLPVDTGSGASEDITSAFILRSALSEWTVVFCKPNYSGIFYFRRFKGKFLYYCNVVMCDHYGVKPDADTFFRITLKSISVLILRLQRHSWSFEHAFSSSQEQGQLCTRVLVLRNRLDECK